MKFYTFEVSEERDDAFVYISLDFVTAVQLRRTGTKNGPGMDHLIFFFLKVNSHLLKDFYDA